MRTAYVVFFVIGLLSTTGFVVLYGFTAPWWKDRMGIHLWAYSFNLWLIYIISVMNAFHVFSQDARQGVTLGLTITTAVVATQRLYEYIRVHYQERKKRGLHRKEK